MNYSEMTKQLTQYAARGVVEVLEHAKETMVGPCVVRVDLSPRAAVRANSHIFEDMTDNVSIDEQLPDIDAKFIDNHWRDIRLYAARELQKYIIPDTDGVYLGTFEDWQTIPNDRLLKISDGLRRLANLVADIAEEQGGTAIRWDQTIKQLPPGE